MNIARIRQDYYPVPSSPISVREGTGSPPRSSGAGSVLPAERVVEGEWQKGHDAAGDTLFERVWRQRQTYANERTPLPPDTQRAIDAYRDQSTFFDRRTAVNAPTIDYYA